MAKDKQGEVDFENTIERLLIVRGGSKSGKNLEVCVQKQKKYSQINQYQLEIEAPLKIFGDAMFMFKYFDHLRIFEHGGYPPESNYLFLGDYVHRGKQSLETICLLLPQKIKYPENFFLLRGNHASINRIHIFYDEINKTTIKKKQTTIYNQIMKNIYRLFQLFACGSINR